jgi:hypothetical protein
MTNEQLYILLDGMLAELYAALEKSRSALMETRSPVVGRQHRPLGFDCLGIGCKDPEHFEEVETPDPVTELAPLDDALDRLSERAAVLRRS